MARLVVSAVIGVAVGYFSGSPQLGYLAFSLAYGLSAPDTKVQGARLDDLKAPTASYGATIAYIEGHPRIAGNWVWCSEKREIATETSQGKGPGVDTTNFTYELDCLILFSENQLVGVRRIWSNGELVWTHGDNADARSIVDSQEANTWRAIRFYSGAEDQMPDPIYEAAVGAGYAPAYRGRASVFIEGLNLGSNGQIPVLTFEVVSHGEDSYLTQEGASVTGYGSVGAINTGTCSFDPAGFDIHVPQWDALYDDPGVNVYTFSEAATEVNLTSRYSINPAGSLASTNVMLGTTDVSCLCIRDAVIGAGHAAFYAEDGGRSEFDFAVSGQTNRTRFARRGDWAVFWGGGDSKIYKAASTGGAAVLVSAASIGSLGALAISSDGFVYAAEVGSGVPGDANIFQLDLATMTVQETIPIPATETSVGLHVYCDNSTLYLLTGVHCWRYTGSAWVNAFPNLPSEMTVADVLVQNWAVHDGNLWVLDRSVAGPPFDWTPWVATPAINAEDVPLDEVVERQCERAGLPLEYVDASALAPLSVRAMAVSQMSSPRQVIDTLAGAYLFESVESGGVLKYVRRGGAPALTIPPDDLGATDGDESPEALPLTTGNDIEIAAQVIVKFSNVDDDYQDGSESSDRLITGSSIVAAVEVPLGLTPTEAKRLADARVMDAAASVIRFGPVSLSRKYVALEPTDVAMFTGRDGSLYRGRILKHTYAGGVITIEGVLDDATAIDSQAETSGNYTSSTLVRAPSNTILEPLDIPLLRDADDNEGWYAAAKSAGERWQGYVLYKSVDGITAWTQIATASDQAVFGRCTTVLPDWTGGHVFDEVSSVTVDVGAGALSSSTRDAMLADETVNAFSIGVNDRQELGQFRDAALTGAGVYLLTGLLRGSRGTEWAVGTHAADDTFVLLRPQGLRRIADAATDIGVTRYYKAVTVKKSLAGAIAEEFIDEGVSMKPFSPVDLRGSRLSSGAVRLTCLRRTRLATRFAGSSGINVPLGETIEAYQFDIWNSSYTELKRTLDSSTPLVDYTLDHQVIDFGAVQQNVYCKVYQISSRIGRGYPLVASVDVGDGLFFTPAASNSYPDARLSIGDDFVFTRNGSPGTDMGFYRWAAGDPASTLIASVTAVHRYLQGYHLRAMDPAGTWLMYLRAIGNESADRKLLIGNVATGSVAQVFPAFMPADPPFAMTFVGGEFLVLCVSGDVYHSPTGEVWTPSGTLTGSFTLPVTAQYFDSGKIVAIGGDLAMCYMGGIYYNAAADGLTWADALGDVAAAPVTYDVQFSVLSIDSTGSFAIAVAIGEATSPPGQFAKVYSSTDGATWDLEAGYASTGISYPGLAPDLTMSDGLICFDGDFYSRHAIAPLGPGQNVALATTFSGGELLFYAPLAAYGAPGATRIAAINTGGSDEAVSQSDDGDVWTDIDWPD